MISDIPPSTTIELIEKPIEFWQIFLTLFLVFLNGFFVAAEFAIVKVRTSQINSSTASPKIISAAKTVTNNLDNYLAATQLGITIASLGLGWVGEGVTAKLLTNLFSYFPQALEWINPHKIAAPLGFIIITILHIVFGELAPKSIAIRKAASTTMAIALPLRIFYFIFRPVIALMNGLANAILRVLGIAPIREQEIHTEEEIKLIISESEEGGQIEDSERELINNVFDFDTRRARDILTHRKDLVSFEIGMPVDELIQKMIEEGYSRYPIYEENPSNIIGILNVKDIFAAYTKGEKINTKKLLREAFYIPESMKIKELLKVFQKDHLQLAVVSDEFGDIAGIVTMEDILEELVGDIQDEHDAEQPIVIKQSDDTYLVSGYETLEDINEHLPFDLPTNEAYSTLSGLITFHIDGILTEGDEFTLEGYDMKIISLYRSSVEKVQLKPTSANNENK